MNAITEPKVLPDTPSKRGDIIACGVYEGSTGDSVCWCDFVSDELLYAVSKGARGWATVRNEPQQISDEQKQNEMSLLQKFVFTQITCGLEVVGNC